MMFVWGWGKRVDFELKLYDVSPVKRRLSLDDQRRFLSV